MIWRLCNLLFGWDYIAWDNGADRGVARVWIDGLDRAVYWRYKSICVADQIKSPEQVYWLTCKPSKYLKRTEHP